MNQRKDKKKNMSAGGTQRWHGGERDIWSVGKYLGLAPGSPHKGQQLPASVEARPSLPVGPDFRMVHKAPSIPGLPGGIDGSTDG